ncbi:MAG: hypothetical protein JHC31_10460 [Sulfurihydrogenibium sp.]|jgi:hypothetical protein|nr:hypothetical protein [Sulfurihydrogenibium sp.]
MCPKLKKKKLKFDRKFSLEGYIEELPEKPDIITSIIDEYSHETFIKFTVAKTECMKNKNCLQFDKITENDIDNSNNSEKINRCQLILEATTPNHCFILTYTGCLGCYRAYNDGKKYILYTRKDIDKMIFHFLSAIEYYAFELSDIYEVYIHDLGDCYCYLFVRKN